MPLYYFHLRDGVDVLLDPEGQELDGEAAIAAAALREARSMISADALEGRIRLDLHIDVEDGQRRIVHRLEFTDAIRITGAQA